MRPTRILIEDVADVRNLSWAFWRAARGLRDRSDVRAFASQLDAQLGAMATAILDGTMRLGRSTRFVIHDPKRRVIHAPVFEERVLHHALMRHLEPVLERALVADTFACRVGIATVQRSALGVALCGFRVLPHVLRLSRRRRRRYAAARRRCEAGWWAGCLGDRGLQEGFAAALAITAHAEAAPWRRVQLRRVPPIDA